MPRGVITMSELGSLGRFGNQLMQYAFLKTYARDHDLEVQVPPWIGNYLFGCSDPPIEKSLPQFVERYDKDPERMMIPRLPEPLKDVDVSGYFQYPTTYYAPHKEYIRTLFTPVKNLRLRLERAVNRLRQMGETVVGIHLRRGDFGYDHYYITPTDWYLEWLDTIWPTLKRPVLFVACDEPHKVLGDFERFHPVTAADLGVRVRKAPYYPDFFLLSGADVLAIPNSSFSFVAAMLNRNLRQAFRSHLSDPLEHPPFRRLDPWNGTATEHGPGVESYPHIKGLSSPTAGHIAPPKKRWLNTILRRCG